MSLRENHTKSRTNQELSRFESTIANLGTITKTVPGDYFIGLSHEDGEGDVQYGIVPPPKSTPKSKPKYEGKVVSPSTFGRILVRALIKNNGSDLAHVQGPSSTMQLNRGVQTLQA